MAEPLSDSQVRDSYADDELASFHEHQQDDDLVDYPFLPGKYDGLSDEEIEAMKDDNDRETAHMRALHYDGLIHEAAIKYYHKLNMPPAPDGCLEEPDDALESFLFHGVEEAILNNEGDKGKEGEKKVVMAAIDEQIQKATEIFGYRE